MPKAFSIPDTARMLAVSVKTIRRMVAEGQLASVTLRGRRVVPAAAIDRLLAKSGGNAASRRAGDVAHKRR